MNLLSINLLSDNYKLLKKFKQPIFIEESPSKRLDPICFAGLNGTGKSNLLELIADGFYLCEYFAINKKLPIYEKSPLLFEFEYSLIKGEATIYIKVSRNKNEIIFSKKASLTEKYKEINQDEYLFDFLPSKIVGYSSGMNETLSIPFYEIQTNISEKISEVAQDPRRYNEEVTPSRLFYLDSNNSLLLIVSNLFFNQNVKVLKKHIGIKELKELKIVIDRDIRVPVKTNKQIDDIIDNIAKCTPHIEKDNNKTTYTFLIDSATRSALQEIFKSPIKFFNDLCLLNNLNVLAIKKDTRQWIKNKRRDEGVIIKTPSVPEEEKFFRFEEIKIENSDGVIIDYVGLSDGEHQYLQTIGSLNVFSEPNTLFLFDEPDTHFNPQWRSQLIYDFSTVAKQGKQEILITSHSPFLLSSIRRKMVFCFTKIGKNIKIENPRIETFGTSIDIILSEIFGINESIPTLASNFIGEIFEEKDYKKALKLLQELGSSYEKMKASKYVKSLNKE
jgi:restriction system-associated AAA family ATPase